MWVDNVLEVSLTGVTAGTNTRVNVGRRADNAEYFAGDIDQFKVWNQALENANPSNAVSELYQYPCR
jgi:hypothetical protein